MRLYLFSKDITSQFSPCITRATTTTTKAKANQQRIVFATLNTQQTLGHIMITWPSLRQKNETQVAAACND